MWESARSDLLDRHTESHVDEMPSLRAVECPGSRRNIGMDEWWKPLAGLVARKSTYAAIVLAVVSSIVLANVSLPFDLPPDAGWLVFIGLWAFWMFVCMSFADAIGRHRLQSQAALKQTEEAATKRARADAEERQIIANLNGLEPHQAFELRYIKWAGRQRFQANRDDPVLGSLLMLDLIEGVQNTGASSTMYHVPDVVWNQLNPTAAEATRFTTLREPPWVSRSGRI
jgi:hypothetical protein